MFPSLWQEEKLKRELWETMITVCVMILLRDVPLLVAGGEAEEGAVGDHDHCLGYDISKRCSPPCGRRRS